MRRKWKDGEGWAVTGLPDPRVYNLAQIPDGEAMLATGVPESIIMPPEIACHFCGTQAGCLFPYPEAPGTYTCNHCATRHRQMAQAECRMLQAEVAYLRRQIALDDNWQDPEFGGCTPDPLKPEHLKERP